jgi:pSer/pThr/pTyr-binding forkhead associated (FHA) protein
MTLSGTPCTPSEEVVVQLLDAALGRAVKSWKFLGRNEISIGRMPERDIEINDPYVSRLHAELHYCDGHWLLLSRGRNGVVVRNRQVTELPIESEVTFQLGPSGPVLRFSAQHQDSELGRTLCFDSEPLSSFALDESKLHTDVGQIADGDYFQKLQAQAKTLRARRHS